MSEKKLSRQEDAYSEAVNLILNKNYSILVIETRHELHYAVSARKVRQTTHSRHNIVYK